ncbi:MAG TPA: hypothetical protein VJN93_02225 [Candidatus Acidoferrum sp.]|nr:hypothetical protein [Candidatus Acidoferrum sp.]
MATPANAIFVPKTERGAFNPNRTAGLLLRSQALHLREALLKHLEELAAVLAIDPKTLITEGDVSAYVHRATAILHTHSRRPSRK